MPKYQIGYRIAVNLSEKRKANIYGKKATKQLFGIKSTNCLRIALNSIYVTNAPPRKGYPDTAVSKSGIRIVFTLPKEGTL